MAPPAKPTSRSWARAVADIRDGAAQRELWAHLGWQDIKQRYRRSVIGPLWITISMGVISLGLGLLYSQLLGNPLATFLPYVTAGFIVWGFINGCLVDGMDTFISNEGLLKHLPAPLTVYVLRTVWRQALMFAHNLVVYVVVLIVFFTDLDHPYAAVGDGVCANNPSSTCHPGLGWWALLAIPGFVLLALSGGWVTVLLGIISTRYRDIPQVISALIQLVFYLTPIVWAPETLGTKHASLVTLVVNINPLYHYIQVVRAPLIGQAIAWYSWAIVGSITVVGWALAFVALRNYRARVSYWV